MTSSSIHQRKEFLRLVLSPDYDLESAMFAGSNVTYDDSMNLRNILWLAPLPSRSNNAWEAPGTFLPYPFST